MHTRKLIEASARAAADHAGPHLDAAIQYVDEYARLPWHAFGVLPGSILNASYRDAHESQLANLRDGRGKLQQMIEGLAQVAYTYWRAERASTLTVEGKRALDLEQPTSTKGPVSTAVDYAGAVAGVLTVPATVALRPHWSVSAATKGASARLCPLAIVSVLVWLLLEPDDDATGRANAAWTQAAEHLKGIGDLSVVMGLSDEAWSMDSPSRVQFNAWLANFQTELSDAAHAAADQVTAMDDVVGAIRTLQASMVIADLACLAAMIMFSLMQAFPFTALGAIFGKIAVAITNAIATTTAAAAILGWIGAWAAGAITLANAGTFKKMDVEPGGVETTFVDLQDPTDGWANA